MSAMTGRSSTRSPNSTRPTGRGRTRSASRPVSSLRNGAVPNCGSSPTSSPCSSTAGRGKTTTETDANFTGRPSACDALDAISACTRGVSTTNGTATIAAIATTTTTTRTPTVHQRARITEERRGRLRRLDRRQTPGVGSDRARERPVLLDVLPRPRAVHNAPPRAVPGGAVGRSRPGHGAAACPARIARPVGARPAAGVGGLGRALAPTHHPHQEEDAADDEQNLEFSKAATEAAAEELPAEEAAEREAGDSAHEAPEEPWPLGRGWLGDPARRSRRVGGRHRGPAGRLRVLTPA